MTSKYIKDFIPQRQQKRVIVLASNDAKHCRRTYYESRCSCRHTDSGGRTSAHSDYRNDSVQFSTASQFDMYDTVDSEGLICLGHASNRTVPPTHRHFLPILMRSHIKQWGTGIGGLMRGMVNLPQGNQELLVVRDKVGRPPSELGVSKSMECDIFPSVL